MPALRIIDVSDNKLEHSIPASFANMTYLKFFFAGNRLLCGSSLLGLPGCKKGHQWSLWKILLLSVAFFIVLKIVIGLFLLRRCLRRDKGHVIHLGKEGKVVMFKGGDDQQGPDSKAILRAVRKLKKEDIVGEGGFGVVFRLELEDKKVCPEEIERRLRSYPWVRE